MEECQGRERPGWYLPNEKVEIMPYDYNGYYGRVKNHNDKYRSILEKEYSFRFLPYNEIVC